MKVLILGATGMIGSAMMREFTRAPNMECIGTIQSESDLELFDSKIAENLVANIDATKSEQIDVLLHQFRPEAVINCIGLVKQNPKCNDPLLALELNALFPHRMAKALQKIGARMIHFSTDCVFSGDLGNYYEGAHSDAKDLYGRSKFLGEVTYPHTVTLRTSTIGHELKSPHGLVEWFLAQKEGCNGYVNAIFSGLPTSVLANLVRTKVITNIGLSGLYHVSSSPISKYNLLKLIAVQYERGIHVAPSGELIIDRSLNSECFKRAVGWVAPSWEAMIKDMHNDYRQYVQK